MQHGAWWSPDSHQIAQKILHCGLLFIFKALKLQHVTAMLQHSTRVCLDSMSAEILSVFYLSGASASRKCRSFWKCGLAVWPLAGRPKLFSHAWDSFRVSCVFGWFLWNDEVYTQRTIRIWCKSYGIFRSHNRRTACILDPGPGRCIVLQLQLLGPLWQLWLIQRGVVICCDCWGRRAWIKRLTQPMANL